MTDTQKPTSNVLPFRALRAVRKDPPPIKMAKTGAAAEIYIYDTIGAGWFEDGVTAKQFAKDLDAMKPFDTLTVYINSPGGSVFEGVAIYNIIARQQAVKVVKIDGLAGSIASVIAMAGDRVEIAANGILMIHNPWSIVVGDATEMRKAAETLDTIRETILGTYAARAAENDGASAEELGAMMDAESWLKADQALEAGLADVVIDAVDIAAMAKFDLSVFDHPPETLAAAAKTAAAETETDIEIPAEAGRPHPAVVKANARVAAMRARKRG